MTQINYKTILFIIFFLSISTIVNAKCINNIEILKDSGFQEIIIIVSDLKNAKKSWVTIGQYEVICANHQNSELSKIWKLNSETQVSEILLRKGRSNRSYIRLVHIEGLEDNQIRSSGMPWDTGGYFDLYHYVSDVDKIFNQLRKLGWQAYNDPIQYELQIFKIKEVIIRGPNGEVLCLMQREEPPYDKNYVESNEGISWPFNIVTIVENYRENINFFENILGWHVYLSGENKYSEPGFNPSGIPSNLASKLSQRFTRFSPTKTDGFGSIQVLKNNGLKGKNFSPKSIYPNLGLYTTRFIVSNINVLLKRINDNGYPLETKLTKMKIDPYGLVKIIALNTPSGARIEFLEVIN